MKVRNFRKGIGKILMSAVLVCLVAALLFPFGSAISKMEGNPSQAGAAEFVTVTFHTNGGDPVPPVQNLASGQKATKPDPSPQLEGQTFIEWLDKDGKAWDFDTPVVSSIDLYARYEVRVDFDTDDGLPQPDDQWISPGFQAIKPATDPVKEGYVFSHWENSEGTEWDFKWPIGEHMTLYAVYDAEVTVKFDTKGGKPVPADQTFVAGNKATKPAEDPALVDNKFIRWVDKDGKAWDFNTEVWEDMTLYATYEAIPKKTPEPPKKTPKTGDGDAGILGAIALMAIAAGTIAAARGKARN
ncbi:MAG: InlB B-repeat-containing protein [Anaerovoracaceae bacterium]|jgi:hypothetical protein